MFDWIYALILGIVQGITEFLPVSSSAHLIVSSWLSGRELPLVINVSLHFGTVLAVLFYFRDDWFKLIRKSLSFIQNKEKSFESHILLPGIILGTFPAGIIGLLFKDKIEEYLHHPIATVLPLIVIGLALWLVDQYSPTKRDIKELRIRDAFYIGLAQAIALIPGVSRSGATILAGRYLSFDRVSAAKFSFLLGTPAMLAATLLVLKDTAAYLGEPVFYFSIFVSFISGLLAIKFLLKFLEKTGLFYFAVYRIILAMIIFIFCIT